MPLGAAAIGGIAAGAASLLGTGANIYGGAVKNRRQRKWAEEQSTLEWERKMDAWGQMNEYNSPASQMERLKEAGLNPHLMYEQGNVGNAGSHPQVQQHKAGGYEWQQQKFDAVQRYQDFNLKKIQTNNLKKIGDGIQLANDNKALENTIKGRVVDHLDDKWSYQTEAWNLANKYKGASIDNIVQQMDARAQDILWKNIKLLAWEKYKINIDKDNVPFRWIGTLGGTLINTLKERRKSRGKPRSNFEWKEGDLYN